MRILAVILALVACADNEEPSGNRPEDSDVQVDDPPAPLLDAPPPTSGGFTDITPPELRDLEPELRATTVSATFCRLDDDPAIEVLVATTLHGGFGPVYEFRDGELVYDDWTLTDAGLQTGTHRPWALGCIDLDNDGIDEILQTQADRISTRGDDGVWRRVEIDNLAPECDDVGYATHALGVDDVDGNGLLDVIFETSTALRDREGCDLGPIMVALQTAPLQFEWNSPVTPDMWQRVWAFRVLHDTDPPALLAAGQRVNHIEEATGWYLLDPGWPASGARALSPYDNLLPRRNPMGLLLQDLDGDGLVEQVDSPTQPRLAVHSRRSGIWTNVSDVVAIQAPPPVEEPDGRRMFPWAISALHLTRRRLPDLVVNHGDDDASISNNLIAGHRTVAHYHRGVSASGNATFALWPTPLGDLEQPHNSRSVSTADIDGDGDQDLLIGGAYGDGIRLYLDDIEAPGLSSTTIRLRGRTNSVGSGARITALVNGEPYVRWIAPGGTTGTITTPEWSLGMEDATEAQLDILWPSGTEQTVTVVPGAYLEIDEP